MEQKKTSRLHVALKRRLRYTFTFSSPHTHTPAREKERIIRFRNHVEYIFHQNKSETNDSCVHGYNIGWTGFPDD